MTSDPHDDELRVAIVRGMIKKRDENYDTDLEAGHSSAWYIEREVREWLALRDVPPEPPNAAWVDAARNLVGVIHTEAHDSDSIVVADIVPEYHALRELVESFDDAARVPVEPPEPSEFAEIAAAANAICAKRVHATIKTEVPCMICKGFAEVALVAARGAVRSSVPADNPKGES